MKCKTEDVRQRTEGMKYFIACSPRLAVCCLLSVVSCLLSSLSLNAQINFKEIDYIPVSDGTRFLDYPWAGGLNSSQFCDPDLNGDGLRDLLVYEKTENRVITFIAKGPGEYSLDRAFIPHVPEIQGWVVTKDMNCDGIDELLTYSNGSIMVYRGYRDNDTLKFSMWSDGIYYQGNSSRINLYSTFVDRPAIADLDFDGDPDILTFNVTSNRMLWYKNQRIESELPCDTLAFILKDNCWGNVFESGLSPIIDMRDTCEYKLANGRVAAAGNMRHAGSTLEAFDIRGRGVPDVLMGDVTLSIMNHLKNDGTRTYASILAQDTSYPSYNVPVSTSSFPLAVFIDVDHDGKKDMIVTPFEGLGVDNYENVLLYQNQSADSARLSFLTRSFMVGDMIDVGENAVPALLDVNGDGLKDLVIGGGYRKNGTLKYHLHYYRNTGSEDYPVFRLEQNDFLNFSTLGLSEPFPHAGDLDGDGKIDLLVGLADGRVLFYKNTSSGSSFQTGTPVYLKLNSSDLDVGQNAAPFVIDLDRDGKTELVIGEYNGNVNLYRNTAAAGSVQLILLTDSLGKVTTTSQFMPFGYSTVSIADLNEDGKYDMLLGGYDNVLYLIDNIEDSIHQKVSPQVIASLPSRIGRRVVPYFANVTNENDGTLLVGLQAGGVRWWSIRPPEYRPVSTIDRTIHEIDFQLYPNPNKGQFSVYIPDNPPKRLQWQLIDMMGRVHLAGTLNSDRENIEIPQLPAGIYLFHIHDGQNILGNKLLIKSE